MKLVYSFVTVMGLFITATPVDRGIIPCGDAESGEESTADCTISTE